MNKKAEVKPANVLIGLLILSLVLFGVAQVIIDSAVENDISLEQNLDSEFSEIYNQSISLKNNVSQNSDQVSGGDPDSDTALWSQSLRALNQVKNAPAIALSSIKKVSGIIGFNSLPAQFWIIIGAIVVIIIIFGILSAFRGYSLQK